MKAREGYVGYDERRKRYFARVTATDPVTGKRTQLARFTRTKTEALRRKRELLDQVEREGAESFSAEKVTFAVLARKFEKEKLIPAVYAGEKKIAGRRELSAPTSWLNQLRYYFGSKRLSLVTKGEIEKFKIWLSRVPPRSTIEEIDGALVLTPNPGGGQRSIEALNRPVELLRVMMNFAEEEKLIRHEQNPFSDRRSGKLIERKSETSRERIPTFGEEMALLEACVDDRAHLRPVIIIAADTGLRKNELFSLSWLQKDVDFERRQIRLRAINAKTNSARVIPMTQRVHNELLGLRERNYSHPSGLAFGGLKEPKRSFNTACRLTRVRGLHKHDLRHAFVTRAILAGIPPAIVLKASGHSSDEWKRYLNATPDALLGLFAPLPGQEAEAVRAYGLEILRQLKEALGIFWNSGANPGLLFGELVDVVMQKGG